MPKKKKQKPIDWFSSLLKRKIEDASLRDLAFLTVWLSGAYLTYQGIALTEKITLDLPLEIATWLESWLIGQKPEEPFEIDWNRLLISLVTSYKVLTAEREDILSGLNLLRSFVPSL